MLRPPERQAWNDARCIKLTVVAGRYELIGGHRRSEHGLHWIRRDHADEKCVKLAGWVCGPRVSGRVQHSGHVPLEDTGGTRPFTKLFGRFRYPVSSAENMDNIANGLERNMVARFLPRFCTQSIIHSHNECTNEFDCMNDMLVYTAFRAALS